MKLLHFADLHIGVETYGHINPATGLSTRLEDCLKALDSVVDYAVKEKIDLVLFCGDAYKTREPNPTQQREFAKRISRLSAAGIPVFLLIGNHDVPNAIGRATATEIFDTLAVKSVCVSNRPDIYRITTAGGIIQVASLPWLRRSALLSKEETKALDFEQIKQRLQEALTSVISDQIARLDPALPAVLAAHVWVSGAQLGSEKMMTIGQEHTLLLSNVARREFDYVALGHIHRHQVLSQNPPVAYAGSLERLDFGDENDEKGFYVVEIVPDAAKGTRMTIFEFRPLDSRRFLTIKLTMDANDTDPTATVLKALAGQEDKIRDAIVRLELTVPAASEGLLRDNEVHAALKEAHYCTIARDIQRETRLRLGQLAAAELTPLDALKAFLEAKNTPPERARTLLEYGERLVRGEG